MIVVINKTIAIKFTISITTTIAINHWKKSVVFVPKKVVALINIQKMRNGKQKNFEDKTENFAKIKVNIKYNWPSIKGI